VHSFSCDTPESTGAIIEAAALEIDETLGSEKANKDRFSAVGR